jgi:hypothetical protein
MFVPEIFVLSRLRYFHDGPLGHMRRTVEMMMRGRVEEMVGPEMSDFVEGVLKGSSLVTCHSALRNEEAASLLRACETDDEMHGVMLSGSFDFFMEYRTEIPHRKTVSTVSSEVRILCDGGGLIPHDLRPRRRGKMPSCEISRLTSVSDWSDVMTLEKLAWRRKTIDIECQGKVSLFRQEFPSTSSEAFLSSSTMVFDPEQMILGPVFGYGEILFLDPGTDREVIGGGRKPDKWDVEYVVVNTLDEAIALSRRLRARQAQRLTRGEQ